MLIQESQKQCHYRKLQNELRFWEAEPIIISQVRITVTVNKYQVLHLEKSLYYTCTVLVTPCGRVGSKLHSEKNFRKLQFSPLWWSKGDWNTRIIGKGLESKINIFMAWCRSETLSRSDFSALVKWGRES